MTVKITFNSKEVGHVLVEWIALECMCTENEEHEDMSFGDGEHYYRQIFVIDSDMIIEHNNKDLAELRFEVKDGMFRYDLLDSAGKIVRMFMLPITYVHAIHASHEVPAKSKVSMHKLSALERKKNR